MDQIVLVNIGWLKCVSSCVLAYVHCFCTRKISYMRAPQIFGTRFCLYRCFSVFSAIYIIVSESWDPNNANPLRNWGSTFPVRVNTLPIKDYVLCADFRGKITSNEKLLMNQPYFVPIWSNTLQYYPPFSRKENERKGWQSKSNWMHLCVTETKR